MLKKFKAFGFARLATNAPWMPGVEERARSATDQHSMTDSFFELPVKVVMLSGWGVNFGGGLRESVVAASVIGMFAQRTVGIDMRRKTAVRSMMDEIWICM